MFAIDIHLYINILLLNHKVLIESKESRSGEEREREREREREARGICFILIPDCTNEF